MTRIRPVSRLWLLVLAMVLPLAALGCKRASLCPKGWEERATGKPVQGYWCRRDNQAQYHQLHPQTQKIRQTCSFAAGKAEGPFKAWHPGGQRWIEGQYAAGRLHGQWTQWDERGNKTVEGEYRDGQLVRGAPVGIAAVCESVLAEK